jgi:hypothetical protein
VLSLWNKWIRFVVHFVDTIAVTACERSYPHSLSGFIAILPPCRSSLEGSPEQVSPDIRPRPRLWSGFLLLKYNCAITLKFQIWDMSYA